MLSVGDLTERNDVMQVGNIVNKCQQKCSNLRSRRKPMDEQIL